MTALSRPIKLRERPAVSSTLYDTYCTIPQLQNQLLCRL
jgi:hypothetical protein